LGEKEVQMTTTTCLTLEKVGHVGLLTLQRPDVLNALSQELMGELSQTLDEVNEDRDIRCLVITGAGDKAFSVGFDLKGSAERGSTGDVRDMIRRNFEVLIKIWNLRVPSIAAVNGYAVAAGSNIAMICDVTLASERARFGEPELRHYALSPMLLLPWFNGNPKMVHYLYYSGDTITAEEAKEYGLVAKVIAPDRLLDEAMRMAGRIAKVAPFAVESTKESIRATYEMMGFRNALAHHRMIDTMVIGAVGFEDKARMRELMAAGDMQGFLQMRDGPFKTDG
jgi:enoyl-CoA hydratase/carnithine racemase